MSFSLGKRIVSLIPESKYSWEIVNMSGECRIIRIFEGKRNWCHSVDIFEWKTIYKNILFDLRNENEVLAYIALVVKSMMVEEQPEWSLM
jgi:hypothetical protein